MNYTPPYRVGKKQNRAVLDANGLEVVVFPEGNEILAQEFCQMLNNKSADKYDASAMEDSRVVEHSTSKEIVCAFFDIPESEFDTLNVEASSTDGSELTMPASALADQIESIGSWGFADKDKKEIHLFEVNYPTTKDGWAS